MKLQPNIFSSHFGMCFMLLGSNEYAIGMQQNSINFYVNQFRSQSNLIRMNVVMCIAVFTVYIIYV